jgi:hypothetical protein
MKGMAAKGEVVETGTVAIIKDVYAQGGVKGFYKG